jgi:hypothetical protein
MRKLILTFEILDGVEEQAAWVHGVTLAGAAMKDMDKSLINPYVGVEVKEERASAAVNLGPYLSKDEQVQNAKNFKVARMNKYPLMPRG